MTPDERPYKLPDPKLQPGAFLVLVYKVLKKNRYDDRAWDKIYFARCQKRIVQLLETFSGDAEMAARCMMDLREKFEAEELSWTIETLVQYSFDWKAEHDKRGHRECLAELLGAYIGVRNGEMAKLEPASVLSKILALTPKDAEVKP